MISSTSVFSLSPPQLFPFFLRSFLYEEHLNLPRCFAQFFLSSATVVSSLGFCSSCYSCLVLPAALIDLAVVSSSPSFAKRLLSKLGGRRVSDDTLTPLTNFWGSDGYYCWYISGRLVWWWLGQGPWCRRW